jgi:hypothetical protein
MVYTPMQVGCIFDYLEEHGLGEGGRFGLSDCLGEDDQPDPGRLAVSIFSHPWSSPALKSESTVMCAFRFNSQWPGIEYLAAAPGFDMETAWTELAALEQAALGTKIFGKCKARR